MTAASQAPWEDSWPWFSTTTLMCIVRAKSPAVPAY
jgi:hypothetical protein